MQSVEKLNEAFGVPGRIEFRPGHCGHPEAVLANENGTAVVALYGANVLSYRPAGGEEIIFHPLKDDYGPDDFFHGGIPVCWPQFGQRTDPHVPQHGFVRRMAFAVREARVAEGACEITLGVTETEETRRVFPHAFDLEVRVRLSDRLDLALVTRNTGTDDFGFTGGFHPYFLVRERRGATVTGLTGLGYTQVKEMTDGVQAADLVLEAPRCGRAYAVPSEPRRRTFSLVDGREGRTIRLEAEGLRSLVVWHPESNDDLEDFTADDWRRFVCVEPVSHWPVPLRPLAPGETHALHASITVLL